MATQNIFEQDGFTGITYNFYKILDLRPPCTDEELTKAYKKMAVKYHPDKASGCNERFQKIKEAHDMLKEPILRKYYDKYGDSGLAAIFRDGSPVSGILDLSTWYGRFYLKTLTCPTSLIPYLLFIAFIGILFIYFLNFIDKKLYDSGLKEIPWPLIFSLLWIVELFFLIIVSFYIFLNVANFKFISKIYEDKKEWENFTESRRRLFSRIMVTKAVFNGVIGFLFIALSIYCSAFLALNLNDTGNLVNGVTWKQIFNPEILLLSIYSVLNIIFKLILLFSRNNPTRLWKERSLFLFHDIYSSLYLLIFIDNFGKWLDSNDRTQISLSFIFVWLYARIALFVIKNILETRWRYKDLKNKLQSEADPSKRAEIEKMTKTNYVWANRIIYIGSLSICLVIGLVHSHFSNNWPQTWSYTFFPLQICVYSSIFVFGCIFPCIVACLEFAIPPNSYDNFISREDYLTIIEIPSIYPFGFGLAPLQPRIKFR